MKRKIYQDLIKWKEKNGRTALLIEDARRVGKSYIVHEFAQKEYRSFIMIDFSKSELPKAKALGLLASLTYVL